MLLGHGRLAEAGVALCFFNIAAFMVVLYSALAAVKHAAGPVATGPKILCARWVR